MRNPKRVLSQGADPRPGVELRLRRPGQRRRALHLLPAQEDRRRPRADDPHDARRRATSSSPPTEPAGPPRPAHAAAPVSRWTLRAKLLASVAAARVTMLATGAAHRRLTAAVLEEQLDRGPADLPRAGRRPPRRRRPGARRPGFPGAPFRTPGSGDTLVLELTADGSVAVDGSGVAVNSVVDESGASRPLSAAQIADRSPPPPRVEPASGSTSARASATYLVTSRTLNQGDLLVVGLPPAPGRGADRPPRRRRRRWQRRRPRPRRGRRDAASSGAASRPSTGSPPRARGVSRLKLDTGDVALAVGCRRTTPTSGPRSARSPSRSTRCSTRSRRRSQARQESETQVRQFVADA